MTVEIRDFSHSPDPKRFRINDDIFEASPELPLGLMQELVKLRGLQSQVEEHGVEAVISVFDMLLLEKSAARFRERTTSKTEPIGVSHVMEIIPWLLEEYGLRPTQPSPPSSDGSSDGTSGTSSTGGRSLEELTRLGSQLTEPSTSSTTTP